ncbi:MAG: sulfite exporter TauE/SafE family protein [Promethearchaeota archaeon]|nr:MAG: sulfite exporter TauE/SafE family protein [Candidatus Lokiarchaeota archaeon]
MVLLDVILMITFGITAGISTGLTGASGVLIIVPLIDIFLGYSMHMCIGISLIVDVLAPLAIALIYSRYGNIDLKSGGWLAIGSIMGAQVGAILVTGITSMGLGNLYGFVLIIMAIIMFFRGINQNQSVEEDEENLKKNLTLKKKSYQVIITLLLGILVGLMTGILGAGGELIFLIILIFVLQFPVHKAVGTSSLIMAITALSGTVARNLDICGHAQISS